MKRRHVAITYYQTNHVEINNQIKCRVLRLIRTVLIVLSTFKSCDLETMNTFRFIKTKSAFIVHDFSVLGKKTRFLSTSLNCSKLPTPDLRKLADLARIEIDDEEVKEWQPKVDGIVEWFDQLQSVDLSNIPPQLRVNVTGDRLREDLPETFEKIPDLIAQAPDKDQDLIRVPKIN